MQLRHQKSIFPPDEKQAKVTAMCWSPNNKRVAVVTVNRIVHLMDDQGNRKDKFSTKPGVKGASKTYVVRAMAWSPDSTRLAVAQSDNIVFVYKLGLNWGDKKTICNKFQQNSPVTSLTWPKSRPGELIFGLAEGKVKLGFLKNNKQATLYNADVYTVSVCASPDGSGICSGHLDGSLFKFAFEDGSSAPSWTKFATHSSVPYALDWGHACICAGGADEKVILYHELSGTVAREFDYTETEGVKAMTTARFAPSGQTLIVGNWNRFFIYGWNSRLEVWEEISCKVIENLYSVTALAWKPDGSKLLTGGLCGVVDMYDACLRRFRYKGKFEFTYVSVSQVIVKQLSNGERTIVKSSYGYEIVKINVFQDRFIIANTKGESSDTLIMGDMQKGLMSEIPWTTSGKEKFFFDNEAVCMAYNAGELTLVEYASDSILGTCRTEHMNPHQISVCINEAAYRARDYDGSATSDEAENKKIAYLLDIQTIRVTDLVLQRPVATINHNSKIDFIELNPGASMLVFRDKRRRLCLYDLDAQKKHTLLPYCNYVQWVPESNVVVGQNRETLCVWYEIGNPDKMTMIPIVGNVSEIERLNGTTSVVVDEGMQEARYQLQESLIEFGMHIDLDLVKAMDTLSGMKVTTEVEAMWRKLFNRAMKQDKLYIAQRCAVALGDMPQARFLKKTLDMVFEYGGGMSERQQRKGMKNFMVRARAAMLRKNYREAANILVQQGHPDEAIAMWQQLHRHDKAIMVAEKNGMKEVDAMKERYLNHLLDTKQEATAAEMKASERDYVGAIQLYLKGGLPAKAANVVKRHPELDYTKEVKEQIANALQKAGMHGRAGKFFEMMQNLDGAMASYIKGNAYKEASRLAKVNFPARVQELEEQWGDFCVKQKNLSTALVHYIDANCAEKAIEVALKAELWDRAVTLINDSMSDNPKAAKPYYERVARHYLEVQNLPEAERFFVKAGEHAKAVEMYTRFNRWDEAHTVASSYMSESEVGMLYISQAQRMETAGNFKQAEKLYLKVKEPNLAINMYKKARKYDQMIRLVSTYQHELLKETHLHLAQSLEMEGHMKDAEHHYTQAGEWQSAVNMFRANDQWDEAIRVAKLNGGIDASKRVAYAWAMSLGGEDGAKLLARLGLVEQAIDYAVERRAFNHAFELARTCMTKKVPEVHLKKALFLEDEESFKDAEDEFVKAGKPKEAIDMYIHQEAWDDAMRVAEHYDSGSIPDVFRAQADWALSKKDYKTAESLYINGKKPEKALLMYKEAQMWNDAVRICKLHMPHKLHSTNLARQRHAATMQDSSDIIASARMWEDTGDFDRAIDAYLNVEQQHVEDEDQLSEIWHNAVKLAQHHAQERYSSIVNQVCLRLKDINRLAEAALLYKDIEAWKDAVDCYIQAQLWQKGRVVAYSQNPELKTYFDRKYQAHMKSAGDGGGLVREGKVVEGLDVMVQRNQWEKVFKTVAEKGNPAVSGKYAAKYAQKLMQQEDGPDVRQAVNYLAKFGVASNQPAYFMLYTDIASQCFSLTEKEEAEFGKEVMLDCREMLYKLTAELGRNPEYVKADKLKEFQNLLKVAHFICLGYLCEQNGQKELEALFSVALLKDCGPVAWDKAYLKAGQSCESLRWNNLAYMFYSRYLDIIEAIEEEDSSMLDNTDFMDTDLPSPYNMEIPKPDRVFSDKETEEEIREKTLSWAMDDTLDQDSGIDELMTKLKFAQAATAEVVKKSKRWIGDYRPGSRREWDDAASLKQMLRIMRLS